MAWEKVLLRYFNGYVLFPVLEKLTKRKIKPKLDALRSFESLGLAEQKELQKNAIYDLAVFCKENIPYYSQLFLENSFDVEKLKVDINYIQKLPILTKEIIREKTGQLQFHGRGPLHVRKTGGSTGQSVFFYYDNEGLDWTSAINLFAYEMAGKKPHHTDCHISAELELGNPPFKYKMMDYIKLSSQNRKRLMISSFTDIELEKKYRELKSRKPYLLQGHPSSLYAIASYVEKTKKKPVRLCTVFEPTGEMLTPKMVEVIEKYALCKVTNRYGNAEFGVIAHAAPKDHYSKLKVFQLAFYVEPCEQNNLIVTCLTNYGFPLLRYDTGDIGTVIEEGEQTFIKDIQGRIHDMVAINGDQYPSHYIMDFMDHQVRGIREFQIILKDESKFPVLSIVLENKDDHQRVLKAVTDRWPTGLEIVFIEFDELVRLGWRQKFRHLIDLRTKK